MRSLRVLSNPSGPPGPGAHPRQSAKRSRRILAEAEYANARIPAGWSVLHALTLGLFGHVTSTWPLDWMNGKTQVNWQSTPNMQPAGPSNPSSTTQPRRSPSATGNAQITRKRVIYSCMTCRRRKVKCDKVVFLDLGASCLN